MKKTFLILAMGGLLASCGSSNEQSAIQANKTNDSLQSELSRQHTIDSVSQAIGQAQPHAGTDVPAGAQVNTVHHTEYKQHQQISNGNSNKGSTAGTTPVNNTTTTTTTTNNNTTTTATTPEKKHWSAKADGALIGAGAGAITGALLDSKKKGQAVKGGIIGGVIGAAAGLGAGAIIDKEKKNKQDAANNANGQ